MPVDFKMDNRVRYLFDAKLNILELPAKLTHDIQEVLDSNPEISNWRAFIQKAEFFGRHYTFSRQDVEKIGSNVFQGSPSDKLFTEFGSRGMCVHELVHILDKLKLEKVLIQLKSYECIEIKSQPANKKHLKEGDALELEVKATGFPYPRYQWFRLIKDEWEEIDTATDAVYKVPCVSTVDEGIYCCRLHNGGKPHQCIFTEESTVSVDPNPGYSLKKEENGLPDVPDGYPTKPVILPEIVVQPRSAIVNIGETLELMCDAIGQCPLVYKWYQNGIKISQNQILKIISFSQRDEGTYKCEVSNQFGKTESQECTLQMNDIPYPDESAEIEILLNPKTCAIEIGGTCIFKVEAMCKEALTYQWYKDGVAVQKEGANTSELRFDNIQDFSLQGLYQCMLRSSTKHMLSLPASLSIKMDPSKAPEYRPTDKVALLIGNYDYMNEGQLNAPKMDVYTMAENFRSLDFKVVSLLNLTKVEMLSAIDEFVKMLGKGVYGVFYFCGHGFEEDGQCYFVPPDARVGYTIEDCVSSTVVHKSMQKPEPALVTIILDICRNRNKMQSPVKERTCVFPTGDNQQTGNTIYIYATSEGMNAYEDRQAGILVKYLCRYIHENISLIDVFKKVADDWSQEQKHSQIQIPEFKASFFHHQRSLADRIITKGYTQSYHSKTLHWQSAHEKPRTQEYVISDLGDLKVELEFQAEFSNVLNIFTTVKSMGKTSKAVAFLKNWPKSISIMGDIKKVCSSPVRTKTVLQDLQKLKAPLCIDIIVKYCLYDDQAQYTTIPQVKLGLPLIANLHLWQPRRIMEPMEHVEDSSI